MLWSGGKDSFASYYMAASSLGTVPSDWLFVTFVPPAGDFHCHPLGLLERHSAALGIEHLFVTVDLNAWQVSYSESFRHLRNRFGVDRVFSGDILFGSATVDSYWLLQLLEDAGIELTLPLAGMYARPLFERLREYKINAIVTGVADWVNRPQIVGREISLALLHSSGIYRNPYFDLAGEQGEYHTTVLAAGEMQFVSPDEAASFERTRRVDGMNVSQVRASLLQLRSPRVDLNEWVRRP